MHGQELVGTSARPFIHENSRDHSRLKVLKDEIKKPYFISLKKFLWEEGVRGPDDSVKGLKVYPIRKLVALISYNFG